MAIELIYPDIDPARFGQLRSYLYQLVDRLQYALNETETSIKALESNVATKQNTVPEEVLVSLSKVKTFIKGIDDVVTESGEIDTDYGKWEYKKWGNGGYQAFGTFTVTPSGYTQSGLVYRTDAVTVPMPFEAKSLCASGMVSGYLSISDYALTDAGSSISLSFAGVAGAGDIISLSPAKVSLAITGQYNS